jgi:hypothetical protein
MERNLPATQDDTAPDDHSERPMEVPRRPVSVAFLPLALIVYVVLAFTIAAWTFLHAAF